jgi:hypothetical protein
VKRILIAVGLGILTELAGVYAIVGGFGATGYMLAFWAHLPSAALPSAPAGALGWLLFVAAGILSWSIAWWLVLFLAGCISRGLTSDAA